MPKKPIEPKVTLLTPNGDRFIVTMSRGEADKYPLYSHHVIDYFTYQVTAHLINGDNIDVQFTKA